MIGQVCERITVREYEISGLIHKVGREYEAWLTPDQQLIEIKREGDDGLNKALVRHSIEKVKKGGYRVCSTIKNVDDDIDADPYGILEKTYPSKWTLNRICNDTRRRANEYCEHFKFGEVEHRFGHVKEERE